MREMLNRHSLNMVQSILDWLVVSVRKLHLGMWKGRLWREHLDYSVALSLGGDDALVEPLR